MQHAMDTGKRAPFNAADRLHDKLFSISLARL